QVEMMAGYRFANGDDTRTLMQLMGNLINGTEVGYLEPVGKDMDSHWFIVFEYDDIGYVKDDEKDSLDANALLKSIRESNEYGNKERKKLGLPPMSIVGWAQPPRYDVETQNLVWAPLIESEGSQVVNFNTRRLGRRGVMSVTLVCDPEDLDKVVPEFNRVMTGFSYKPGQKYAEFKSGDKIAEYGLTALVTGGAVAIAAKSGLLKYGWKLIVAGVAAIGALFKKIFGGGSQSAT
ncbi:MAG: DUF2167 domain-containing protein, partial [Phycisphaerales bacterium]|nr:DUF2167 domain-containing protein [Phycisphaerales bacterium]